MKFRTFITVLCIAAAFFSPEAQAQSQLKKLISQRTHTRILPGSEYFTVDGPSGKLSAVLQLPKGFDTRKDTCDLVIIMHGVMSNKSTVPLIRFSLKLQNKGYAVLRFDFNSQGESEGDVLKCTIPTEIDDGQAIYDYCRSLPYVRRVIILGHSQGGVVAGMLAGRLQEAGNAPDALVLMAPGAVLKDYAREGRFFGYECDPDDPPEYVQVYWYKFSREYILSAQTLPIFEETALYKGPVCVIHGTIDTIVPFRYGEMYLDIFPDCAFYPIKGENHLFTNHPLKTDSRMIEFIQSIK